MTTATVTRQLDQENPWPGLESFKEDAHAFFYGRDDETESLLSHVLDAPVTILYGRSGLGKTSLLQAGLFPMLRDRNFLPVYVRFELKPGGARLSRQLHQSVHDSIRVDLPDAMLPSDYESLWEYLHGAVFELWNAQNYPLTPVIVLDQFEELFTLGERVSDRVRAFRDELGDLAENRIPADLAARIDHDEAVADRFNLRSRNYKLLISLREDFLPHLEEWCRLIPTLGRSRVRLLPLQAAQALDAVRKPASHLMSDDLARRVVDIIDGEDLHLGSHTVLPDVARSGDNPCTAEVEPALLSLFCRELNEERKRRGQPYFDEDLVEDAKRDILSNYYSSCVGDLPPRVAHFIEFELITEKGFRDSYVREDAVPAHLTEDELGQLISSRLLRLEDRYGAQRIELTHDVLTGVVREHRDRRRAEEEKAALATHAEQERQALEQAAAQREAELDRERRVGRRLRWLSAVLAIVCVAAVVLALVAVKYWHSAADAREVANARSLEALAERLTSQAQAILAGGQPGSELEALDKLLAAQQISTNPNLGALLTALRNEARLQEIVHLPVGSLLSADSKRIATHTQSGLEMLDTETWKPFGESIVSNDMLEAVSLDGRYLATSGQDSIIRVWDTTNGQQFGQPMTGSAKWLFGVVVSPDGYRVAATDGNFTTRLWDVQTGRQIGAPLSSRNDEPVEALAFSPDGRRLATAGFQRTVRFWDAQTGAPLSKTVPAGDPRMKGSEGIRSLAFSPDSHFIAAGGSTVGLGTLLSAGMPLRIWNVDSGEIAGKPQVGNYGDIDLVAFSPDGSRVVTGGSDKTVRLWDAHTSQLIGPPIRLQAAVEHVAFTRDGNRIVAVSHDTAQVFDANPDGKFTTELVGSRAIHLAQMQTGYGIDSKTDRPRILLLRDDTLRWFDANTGSKVDQVVSDALRDATQVDESPDERWLAVVGQDNSVRVVDMSSGQLHGAPMKGHDGPVTTVEFSPDGRTLATGSGDNTIRLWDWQNGQQIGDPMTGHKFGVDRIVFSEDGHRLYSFSHDSVRIWDPAKRQPVGKPITLGFYIAGMALSPDGRRIAAAVRLGGQQQWVIQQWDAETGLSLDKPMAGHDDEVNDLAYSPDGKYLVSTSTDNTLRFWDTATGQQIGEPVVTLPIGKTSLVQYSHDGREVFVVAQRISLDGHPPFVGGGVWQFPAPAAWNDGLCDKLTSNPTDEQWKDWISPDIPNTELCPGKPKA
jgi:WD40 repeat protein